MIIEINNAPKIYKVDIELPNNPLRNLNCYIIKGKNRSLVIDTGFNTISGAEALLYSLKELNINIDEADLFITHLHSDHIGLAELFVNEKTRIYMNKNDYDYFCQVKLGRTWNQFNELYLEEGFPKGELDMQVTKNPARIYSPENIFPACIFEDGFEFFIDDIRLQCIHTPGHTPGHTCLYMKDEKIMFLGDHILYDITPNITIWAGINNSLGKYIESLRKMEQYDVKLALPAHRNIDGNMYERAKVIRKHHYLRLLELYKIIKNHQGLNAYEISSKMTWKMRGKSWSDFPVQQKWFAVGETIAHLDYFINSNVIRKNNDNGVYKYYLVNSNLDEDRLKEELK